MKKTPLKRKSIKKHDKWQELLKENSWYSVIPEGSHGSNNIEKKLWRLVSDYVRIRDYLLYGHCISCGKMFDRWFDSQAGHYRPFSKCKGYTKFNYKNCFAQCAYCNSRMNEDKWEGGRIFSHNIINRFGKKHLAEITKYTDDSYFSKREVPELLNMMTEIIYLMSQQSVKPVYWNKLSTHKSLTYLINNDNI